MSAVIKGLWLELDRERKKLDTKSADEGKYAAIYQQLVKAGAAQQLRAKYRGGAR